MGERGVLDWTQKQEVSYCIPEWLKNEQIRLNIARVRGRIEPHVRRAEPIAIACFGPSLSHTWEQIRDFPFLMTCSGSHKFLVDRGLTPDWHVEVDPREHKVGLMGDPCTKTEYLVASTCHRKLLDHLEGHSVKLWHVFDNGEEAARILPRGEWWITGGCSVGLRTMTLAGFLGFRDVHMFGMDGCVGETGSHALDHPNYPKDRVKYASVIYERKEYLTTPGMLEAARQTWHELDQMPSVRVTFYGEGLVQAMAKNYVWKDGDDSKPFENVVALSKPELISAEYRALNTQLHRDNLAYGVGGARHAPTILKLAECLKTTSILDYGAGKGYLAKAIPFPIWEYDPAIPGKDEPPRPADLVACLDVLEHIEPDRILYVLDDLRRVTRKVGYFVIHTGPSSKKLADGRNAHLLQRNRAWWKKMLREFFVVAKVIETPPLLHVVVAPLVQRAAASVRAVNTSAAIAKDAVVAAP